MFEMVKELLWAPGVVGGGVPIDLPAFSPGIDAIIADGTQLFRIGSGFALTDHPLVVHAGAAVDAHANAAVAAHIDHVVHAHDYILQGIAVVGAAAGSDVAFGTLQITDGAAALHTFAGAGATGVQNIAAAQAHDAHGVTQPDAHVSTQPNDHAAAAHVLTGTTPIVAAVATKVDRDTITLSVPTVLGDLLRLRYIPEGARLRVA